MKFGEYNEEHMVSEWRSQYLDYYKGKSKLKKLKAFLETSSGCQNQEDCSSMRRFDVFRDLENGRWLNNDASSVANFQLTNRMEYQPKYAVSSTEINSPVMKISGSDFLADLDDEIEDDEDEDEDDDGADFKVVSLIGKLSGSPSPQTEVTTPLTLDETKPLLNKSHRSHSTSILYVKGQNSFSSHDADIVDIARRQFLEWVDSELDKVNGFFKYKEHECRKRFVVICDQLEKLKQAEVDWKDNISESAGRERTCVQGMISKVKMTAMSLQERANFIFNYFEMPKLPKFFWKSDPNNVHETIVYKSKPPAPFMSRIMIKKAICELYHKIELLESYRTLNQLAFRKLIKKYDKKCDDHVLTGYMGKVAGSNFISSKSINQIQQNLEDKFTDLFENGHRKTAIVKLKTVETKSYYLQDFFSGYLIGVSMPLIALFVYHNRGHFDESYIIHFWASIFLLLLAAFLFSINCVVWDIYKINYKLVFDLDSHDALDYREYLVIPSTFCFIASCVAYASKPTTASMLTNVYVYVSLFILLCPFNVLYLRARIWMIVSMVRLTFSGFYPVEFRDFFFGVMTCSLTYPIANIPQHFSTSTTLVYMTCIPPLWRVMQCLRRFLDTGDWFPHFANLVKYLITTAYFFMVPTYRNHPHLKPAFITIALVNCLYSVFWDVCMDWSLLQDSENVLLRDVLIYKRKGIYYSAILADTILRFQWIVYVICGVRQDTIFLVAVVELVRRFLWLFFRMENEHASNMNLLRVSRVCELPYASNVRDLMVDYDVESGVEDVSVRDDVESVVSLESVYSTNTVATGWQHLSKVISRAHAKEFQQTQRGGGEMVEE